MISWFLMLLIPILWTIKFKYKRRNMYKIAEALPSPKGELPVIGILHKFAGNTEDIMNALSFYSYKGMESKHDGVVKGWINHILYILLEDPVDVEFVLKTCMEKDDLHRFIRPVIGMGGIFAPVSIWRRRRKIMVPAFSPKIVENFTSVFSEQSEILVKQLKREVSKGQFSIWPYLVTFTLDSVFETALGQKIKAQENPNLPFLTSLNQVLNIICKRIFHVWLHPDWLYNLTSTCKQQTKCVKTLHDFTNKIITNKREELKTVKEENERKNIKPCALLEDYKNKSFLDLLIKFSSVDKGYTDVELREEVLTLTIAGTDTSANAIGYTLVLLGKYPEVQQKVYEELFDVFGDSDRPLEKEDLLRLKYLERVVKESLRLFPPVPFIIRKSEEDTKLPSGRVIPAGSGIAISIWGLHRNPKHWGPDAEHFDPDRFLPERLNLKHPCSFMPFSQGPRNCLGYQYALMSIKTTIANLVRNFRILAEHEEGPVPKIRVKIDIMMKAVEGYTISLEERKKMP